MRQQIRVLLATELKHAGGRARRRDVLIALEHQLPSSFTQIMNWKNEVSWVRKDLIIAGWMVKGQWGIWELSERFHREMNNLLN